MKLKLLILGVFLCSISVQAQEYFPKNDGVKTRNTNYTVFKNAKIHVDPQTVINNGMFAIREGKITAVGKSVNIPKNSIIIDLKGKEVYPSFIDLYSDFGIPKPNEPKVVMDLNMMHPVKVIIGMTTLDLMLMQFHNLLLMLRKQKNCIKQVLEW